ncbi:MAG: HD domain-containing phosphohydrolase [Phycisphaerae bacterium]
MQDNKANILVVDDEPQISTMLRKALLARGFDCLATTSSARARHLIASGRFSVIISDISMPEFDGLRLLEYTREQSPWTKVILVTGRSSTEVLAKALSAGAHDYYEKPFDILELIDAVESALGEQGDCGTLPLRAAKAIEMEDRFKQAAFESIQVLVQAVEAKDPYTRKHSEQVAHYAVHISRHLAVREDLTDTIRIAALLHDIGKIGIPDRILTKPARLTDEEFAEIRKHPSLGAEILRNVSMFCVEAQLVRYHHERWDGRGYNEGLQAEEIPFGARLICVADSIDAMLMRRTYKEPFPVEKVLDELERGSETQFDPEIALAARDWVQQHPEMLIQPGKLAESLEELR